MMKNTNEPDYIRIGIAIFLAALLMMMYQAFVEAPRRQQLAKSYVQNTAKQEELKKQKTEDILAKGIDLEYDPKLTRAERLAVSPRIKISSDKLHGSISLKGARIDDLTLAKYKESLGGIEDVILLSPNGDEKSYFAQAGWVSSDGKTKVPDGKTIWKADKTSLNSGDSVNLSWDNGSGVKFIINIALDSNYMFSFEQKVENHSGGEITVAPYGYINRTHTQMPSSAVIFHEGAMGVIKGVIEEVGYKDLHDKGNITFNNDSGWIGFTDQYWLTSLIPSSTYKGSFSHYTKNSRERYQIDYLMDEQKIANGETTTSVSVRLFAGAKEVKVLDAYAAGDSTTNTPPIPLFDRAVDLGMLYFLAKPLFLLLNFFYAQIGNFGLAIMMVTIVVKICLFPLANKSYKAIAKMKILQPEMNKIRERYHDDKIALNKAMMELYKQHKVNPASGCLPILLQMPVFFALYRVLFMTIEMRHAPFFGWLRDLSDFDHSNIFTLFGTINWTPPSALHIGILPIMYCITMLIQQQQQPAPTDPVQAKTIKAMPFIFMYVFASLPAGLVLYWVWSNMISIVQQEIIMLNHGTHRSQTKKAQKSSS